VLSPLFPGYLFTRIELPWRGVWLCPGVIKLVMCGEEPSRVPDEIIAEIRQRERNGFVELPKCKLKAGDRAQIMSGLLAGRRGRYAGEASHQHIKVLLQSKSLQLVSIGVHFCNPAATAIKKVGPSGCLSCSLQVCIYAGPSQPCKDSRCRPGWVQRGMRWSR
jgi:hypothetical protein